MNREFPEIQVYLGKKLIKSFSLCQQGHPYSVGRGEDCDVQLSIKDVSRHHLSLLWDWNNAVVLSAGNSSSEITTGNHIDVKPLTLKVIRSQPSSLPDPPNTDPKDAINRFLILIGSFLILFAVIAGVMITWY